MQNVTCERSFHRSDTISIHRSPCAPGMETSPARVASKSRASWCACDRRAGCHAFRIVQGAHAECSPDCSHLFEVGEESQMLFFEVSSILMQYYTQRFGVTGWARAHPGKSITRSSGSLSSYVVLARQLSSTRTRKKSAIDCLLLLFPQAGAGGGRGVVDLAP